MIIFSSVFIYKKEVIKPVFFKKNRNRFKPTSFDSVILEQKPVLSVYLGFFWFGSVFYGLAKFFFVFQFGLVFSVWLGFFSVFFDLGYVQFF
jgi:hypothetical protein